MSIKYSFRYIIGIDLGTTQTALSYLDLDLHTVESAGEEKIHTFQIPQLVAANQVEGRPTLPSVVFLNDDPESNPGLPWDSKPDFIQGQYARDLGLDIPARLIHSAKSWLCHPRVNRQAPILPWQSEGLARKLSPVQVSTAILEHLRRAWDFQMAHNDPAAAFLRQKIIVTIPASFDPVARNLTLQAINAAGIGQVTLLEEPQAAFYDFIARNPKTLSAELGGVRKVLVIDIGGGTTDFSLIEVTWPHDDEHPGFSRLAVGPHLLIGGDNLDLSLARLVEGKLRHKGKKLAAKQWLAVLNQSRLAKELALTDNSKGISRFVLSGAGSRVIGHTITEEIDREHVRKTLLEGFFPCVPMDALPDEDVGLGISEAGLPYSRDPAVSRHLAAFLAPYGDPPEAVIFNGGTMMSPLIRQRLLDILATWRGGAPPKILENPHPTLAVAAGAVYFGLVTLGLGHRIAGGNPVSLYLGIGTAAASKSSSHVPEQVLCVLPKGAMAERSYSLDGKAFGIDLSREVAFYLYFSPSPLKNEEFGKLYKFSSKRHSPLPILRLAPDAEMNAKMDAKAGVEADVERTREIAAGGKVRRVKIETMLRETGYLQIRCLGIDCEFKGDLAFDLKQDPTADEKKPASKAKPPLGKKQQSQIRKVLDGTFGKGDFNLLFKELGEAAETPRESWNADLSRAVFDIIAKDERFKNDDDAFVWWVRLLGYCLRPGFGTHGDSARVDRLWEMWAEKLPEGHPIFWSEWWLMFKRIAPGLSSTRQLELLQKVEPILFPPKRHDKTLRAVDQHERNHVWRLVGHLERLPVGEKERFGWLALKSPISFAGDAVALYAVGRLGARMLSYAPPEFLIHQAVANQWTEFLLVRNASAGGSYQDLALRELGRKTSDRLSRIDDVLRKRIIDLFKKTGKKKSFFAPLLDVQEFKADDYATLCGEELPSGFVWVKDLAF